MTKKQENTFTLKSIAGTSGVKFETIKQDVKARGEIRIADFRSYDSPVIADYRGEGKHLFFVQGKSKNWSVGARSLKRLESELGMDAVIDDNMLGKFKKSQHAKAYRNANYTKKEKTNKQNQKKS